MSEQINPVHGSRDGAECPGCSHESHFEEKNMSEDQREAIFTGDTEAGLDYPRDKTCGYAQPGPKAPPTSLNGRFILESYKEDRALKATVSNGFAMVAQKVSLKPLTVLADVYSPVTGQCLARRGDKAFVREAYLQSAPWAKQTFTSDNIEGEFIIAETAHIEFVDR